MPTAPSTSAGLVLDFACDDDGIVVGLVSSGVRHAVALQIPERSAPRGFAVTAIPFEQSGKFARSLDNRRW